MIKTIKTSHFGVIFVGTCQRCKYATRNERRRIDAAEDLARHQVRCRGGAA